MTLKLNIPDSCECNPEWIQSLQYCPSSEEIIENFLGVTKVDPSGVSHLVKLGTGANIRFQFDLDGELMKCHVNGVEADFEYQDNKLIIKTKAIP